MTREILVAMFRAGIKWYIIRVDIALLHKHLVDGKQKYLNYVKNKTTKVCRSRAIFSIDVDENTRTQI